MVVAIYARVSTEEQAQHGTSLGEQVRLCEEKARALGAHETRVYTDDGISGTTLERPQLQQLLHDASLGRIHAVVAYDPDRLSRNLTHLLMIVDSLDKLGVSLHFVNFQADLNPDGRLLFSVRGAVAEFEAQHIKARMLSGKRARARQGRPAGGTPIYGYRYSKEDKQWHLDPVEAAVVRKVFQMALRMGTQAIAQQLNAEGIKPRFSKRWNQSVVLYMLRNHSYTGKLPQMRGLGYVEIPPIVSEEEWQAVQAAIDARQNKPPGKAVHSYLLTGHLICGICGRSMTGGYGRPRKRGYVTYYGCTGKLRKPRCPSRFVRSDEMDAVVWDEVVRFLTAPEAYLMAAKEIAAMEDRERPRVLDTERLREEIRKLEAEYDRLLKAFRKGIIDEEDLARQRDELQAEMRVLADQLRAAEAEERIMALRDQEQSRVIEYIEQLSCDISSATDTETRKEVLDTLRVRVVVGPDKQVEIRFGFLESTSHGPLVHAELPQG